MTRNGDTYQMGNRCFRQHWLERPPAHILDFQGDLVPALSRYSLPTEHKKSEQTLAQRNKKGVFGVGHACNARAIAKKIIIRTTVDHISAVQATTSNFFALN